MPAGLQVVSLREQATCCGMEPETVKRVSRNVLYVRSLHFLVGAERDFDAFGFGDGEQRCSVRHGVAHVL